MALTEKNIWSVDGACLALDLDFFGSTFVKKKDVQKITFHKQSQNKANIVA